MSFKDYLKDTTFKYKKTRQDMNVEQYEKFVKSSKTFKYDKKELIENLKSKKEFPIFLEELNKFVIANPNTFKCRDIKSRTDKSLAGTLYNGMLRETKENNKDFYEKLKEMHLSWKPPSIVFDH